MVKLKRIRIDKFRNVKPGTELRFADGFNIVLGKNGTGKTSLLRVIEAALRSDFRPYAGESFEIEYSLECADAKTLVQLKHEPRAEREIRRGEEPPTSALKVEITRDGAAGTLLSAANGITTLTRDTGTWKVQRGVIDRGFLSLADAFSQMPDEAGVWESAKSISGGDAPRFDESTGYYSEFKQHEFLRVGSDELLHFTERARLPVVPSGEDEPLLSATALMLPFLSTIETALGMRSVAFQVTLVSKGSEGAVYGKPRFWMTRRDGSKFDDEILSYGQKRLVSFLYYLALHKEIVIADELVNGLHHDWIELCLREIGKRQAFLTSQNPLLMDYLPFETVEKVRDSFVLCSLEYDGDKEVLSWRNMTEDEAKRVFEAGEIGIEHLSTILRNEGLW